MLNQRTANALALMMISNHHHRQIAIGYFISDAAGEADNVVVEQSDGGALRIANQASERLGIAGAMAPAMLAEKQPRRLCFIGAQVANVERVLHGLKSF